MKIKVTGLKELKRELNSIEAKSKAAINKGLQQTARLILADALNRVPVDKGLLKNSMGVESNDEKMTATVYAAALYAAYQEFGSGQFTEVPKGFEDYAREFYVDGTGRTRPQPFMFPALFANQEKLVPLIEAELVKILKNA